MPKIATRDGPDPVDVFAGAQVLKRRTELGLNQTALATALGITFQQVQKYEKGANRISASRLFAIARELRVPISYFFPAEGEAAPAPEVYPEARDAEARVRRFMRTFEGGRFVTTTAQAGPMITIAVLHVPDAGHSPEELAEVRPLRSPPPIADHEAQDRADARRADRAAAAK